jgi:hypothetical protein
VPWQQVAKQKTERHTFLFTATNGSPLDMSKPFIDRLDSEGIRCLIVDPSMGDLLNKYIADEHLLEIKQRRPGERAAGKDELAFSTANSYLSLCNGSARDGDNEAG